MSRSRTGETSTSQPRLGPAWRRSSAGGRGFQPPSAALDPLEGSKTSNRNSFSVLDMDDDGGSKKKSEASNGTGSSGRVSSDSSQKRTFISRSEGLRSAGIGGGGFGTRSASKGSGSGRSLADLVSRFPSSGNMGSRSSGRIPSAPSAFEDGHDHGHGHGNRRSSLNFVDDKKVIRFTREKLLSMRPRTDPNVTRPEVLKILDGMPLLSKEPLDPVCWDNFDAEEIWNLARERRAAKNQSTGMPVRKADAPEPAVHRRTRGGGTGGGDDMWRRGQALPPAEERNRRGSRYESDEPNDLWDDPMTSNEASADFSAFGGSLDDAPISVSDNAFDLASMAEATKKFDDEVRGATKDEEVINGHDHAVNPSRPLASAGTTIRSGSGDDVNVFEDFDTPTEPVAEPIRSGVDVQSAKSRLMQVMGVTPSESVPDIETESEALVEEKPEIVETSVFGGFGSSGGLSSSVSNNPWAEIMPATNAQSSSGGLDLAAKLAEAKQTESQQQNELEIMRKREEEEEKRRAALLAHQQQAELQARQAAMQNQQQSPQPEYSQVELILIERISIILEKCWGTRSDLLTVLQTLHNEDARVVPLLGTIDALRALIGRHPRRFGLQKDPTFGAEMAVLIVSNTQWKQMEMQRRQEEEHQQRLAQEAEARAKAEAESKPIVITDAPWYYADPQGNIQGPFGGEEMRQWMEAGYFKGDLPISQNQNGGFRTLSRLFPDLSVAFQPTRPSKEEEAKIAELEAKAAAEAEAAARAEAEAREAAEREARAAAEREAAKVAELQKNQNQSAQLKMLLGLGGAPSSNVAGVEETEPIKNVQHDENPEQEPIPVKVDEPLPQSKPAQSQPSRSKETAPVTKEKMVAAAPVPAPAPTPPAPAWGGAGTSKTASRSKSMSEIQKEEARVAAKLARQRQAAQPSGGGWAGIAASGGTTAWSGTTAKAAPAAPAISSSPTKQNRSNQQLGKSSAQNAMNSRSSTQKTLEEFGANDKMTPALENWCKDQMRKLNGSEDLTLVAFCMTLTDPVEIKQYLTAYLGSTPQVNNFASDFIQHKNGTKQQEQWETTGSSKKGRKKKGVVGK